MSNLTDSQKKIIQGIKCKEFTEKLFEKIFETGVGAYSKNDLYDYILYLANKDSKFLNRSNYQNAIDFKITPSKVKNSKFNISLKFAQEDGNEDLLINFLNKLSSEHRKDHILVIDSDKHFEFLIEDLRTRMELENAIKTKVGTTLDYSFNTERVKIEKILFLKLLKNILSENVGFSEKLNDELRELYIDDLDSFELLKKCLSDFKNNELDSKNIKALAIKFGVKLVVDLIRNYLGKKTK